VLRVVPLLMLLGCSARPLELSVDIRTDLAPGADFDSVVVTLRPGQGAELAPVTTSVSAGDPTVSGMRVAEFAGVPSGPSRARAALLDASGAEVLARSVDVILQEDFALTIVLTSDCIGRTCPGTTEPGSYTECLHGQCVDPRCGGSDPDGCGALTCASVADCEGVLGDCVASCIGGACVCTAPAPPGEDAGRVDAGSDAGNDAGPCPGECAPGEMGSETQACGQCGEGTQTRTRTCGADCRWGAFGTFGNCMTGATCTPGQTDREMRACGNCGTESRTRSCNTTTCTWGAFGAFGGCGGQGECAPGATRAGGCDGCSHQVCSGSCNWSGCQLRGGNECEWRNGTHFRCCGVDHWQFCLSSCRWSADCADCNCSNC
jgi:hypothetical protein